MKNSVKNKDESYGLKTGPTNTVIQYRGIKTIVIEVSRILQNIKQVFKALPASILSEYLISSILDFPAN